MARSPVIELPFAEAATPHERCAPAIENNKDNQGNRGHFWNGTGACEKRNVSLRGTV